MQLPRRDQLNDAGKVHHSVLDSQYADHTTFECAPQRLRSTCGTCISELSLSLAFRPRTPGFDRPGHCVSSLIARPTTRISREDESVAAETRICCSRTGCASDSIAVGEGCMSSERLQMHIPTVHMDMHLLVLRAEALVAVVYPWRHSQPPPPPPAQPPAVAVPSLYGGRGGCLVHPFFNHATLLSVLCVTPVLHAGRVVLVECLMCSPVTVACLTRRTRQMPGTAKEHKSQKTPTTNTNDRQAAQLTDQAPGTIERAAQESSQPVQQPCTPPAQQPPPSLRTPSRVIAISAQPTQPNAKHWRAEPHRNTDTTRTCVETRRPPPGMPIVRRN